jgi:hypothetical protein
MIMKVGWLTPFGVAAFSVFPLGAERVFNMIAFPCRFPGPGPGPAVSFILSGVFVHVRRLALVAVRLAAIAPPILLTGARLRPPFPRRLFR